MQVEHLPVKLQIINKYLAKKEIQGEYETIKAEALQKWFAYGGEMLWDKMAHAKELVTHLPLEVINRLGKMEHNRWNAYHILNGWKVMSIEELQQRVQHLQGHEAKSGMQKNKTRKLQACMVSWEELDKVSKEMEHDYKSDDIETIIRIAAIKSDSSF